MRRFDPLSCINRVGDGGVLIHSLCEVLKKISEDGEEGDSGGSSVVGNDGCVPGHGCKCSC